MPTPSDKTDPADRGPARPLRVLLVDDHVAYREGLERALRARTTIVDVVSDETSAREAIVERRPDVVVLDFRLAGRDALDVYAEIQADDPDLAGRLVAMSAEPDGERQREWTRTVGRPVLDKAENRPMLCRAIAEQAQRR